MLSPAMKRVLLLLVGLGLAYFGGRALWRALASPETKIRWTLEGGVAGFNAQRTDPCLEPLAASFVDETTGIGRDHVREALIVLFLQTMQDGADGFPYRLELPRDQLAIEVESGNEAASVELVLRFLEQAGDTEQVAWEIHVKGRMERQDPGWRLVSTTHETVSGRRIR